MLRTLFATTLGVLLWLGPLAAQQVGPAHGALVLVGGAMRDPAIAERFIEIAGGPDAPLVVIPTAGGADVYDDDAPGAQQWRRLGVRRVTVLHTNDRNVADAASFVEPLRQARAVWFTGGRQWRLADAYLGTRTERELHALLARGGVIGGTSAGATIQGSYLVRGDTSGNTIVMGDHEEGFGFLRHVAVDQHLLARNRHFDLIPVVDAHPDLLGIGLDEDTAIVVRGDRFEVIGQSLVAIYDHQRRLGADGRFYFLKPGDTFDLVSRIARRPRQSTAPFAHITVSPR